MSAALNFDYKRYAPDATADRVSAPQTTTLTEQSRIAEQTRPAQMFAPASAARLRWLEDAIAAAEQRALLFRDARDEEAMLLMRRPLTTEQTYARFGLLLGAIVPAAIFARFIMAFSHDLDAGSLIAIIFCLTMNLICALIGWRMGRRVAQRVLTDARAAWLKTALTSMWAGFQWGAVTGAAGGTVCFGIGAFYGALCAITVALPAFLLFGLLRRPLAHGGMIDARHFWPLAYGVTFGIATLILRLG